MEIKGKQSNGKQKKLSFRSYLVANLVNLYDNNVPMAPRDSIVHIRSSRK